MQRVIWYGAGLGTMEDPFVLTNTSGFVDDQPFNILVQHGNTKDVLKYIWIRFTTYQPHKLFRLALLYSDFSPINPFVDLKAGRMTCFNGNNNLGVLDGPYILTEFDNTDYIAKQQMFSRNHVPTEADTDRHIPLWTIDSVEPDGPIPQDFWFDTSSGVVSVEDFIVEDLGEDVYVDDNEVIF